MRAARRAAGPRLELEVERRGVTVERGTGTRAKAAAAAVIPTYVQSQDVAVEGHEHVRRSRKHVRLAETRAEAVVGRLRLEDAHRGPLSQVGQVPPELEPRRDGGSRPGGRGEQRDPEKDEGQSSDKPAHRGRL